MSSGQQHIITTYTKKITAARSRFTVSLQLYKTENKDTNLV